MAEIQSKKVASLSGKDIILFRLKNKKGAYVELLNYGATIVSVVVPDRFGKRRNVVLGYEKPEDYLSDRNYLGCTVGRFANRISGAQFSLNGKLYHLDKNDGKHSNHGGFSGFNKKVFDYKVYGNGVSFSSESRDGEGGFPGNLKFSVGYLFSENNELMINYQAICDQPTIVNLTNHAYFDLGGEGDIRTHELKINTDRYLESDEAFIPTGRVLSVNDSAYDFREYRQMDSMMALKKEMIEGYNSYFIFGGRSGSMKLMASLREKQFGRRMDVYATAPGLQLYTGDYLSGPHAPFSGLCLEAQGFPDAPNQADFPSCTLCPGEEYAETIVYCFSVEPKDS